MKKYLKSILILSAALALFASCQKEELAQSQPAGNTVTQETGTEAGRLVSYSLSKSIPVQDVIDQCKSSTFNNINPQDSSFAEIFKVSFLGRDIVDFEIVTYTIRYMSETRNVNGVHPTVLSGAVSFIVDRSGLINKRKLESVSLINTTFNASALDVTSMLSYFNLRTIYNALAVYPFYQGGDINDGNVVASTEFILKGKQAIDCEIAALELINNLSNVEMKENYYTENIGVSNGGGPALAFQYLLEKDKEYMQKSKKINLRSSYLGEGNYSYAALMPVFLSTSLHSSLLGLPTDMDFAAPSAFISMVAGAYVTWQDKYFAGIKLEDYFSQEFLNDRNPETGMNLIEQFLANEGSIYYDTMEDSIKVTDIINPDLIVFNPEDNTYSYKKGTIIDNLIESFTENECILDGWLPRSEMQITHSLYDEFLSYKTAFTLWKNLSAFGFNYNVKLSNLYILNHAEASLYLIAKDVLLHKHPVEVEEQSENNIQSILTK